MWQVYIDNLDMLEVCDWADLQGLTAKDHHEGMVIARDRYEFFQVPRSLGKEVVRALQIETLGDQIDGFQGVMGPPAVFVRELIHFTLATLNLNRVGRKWMQIWVRVFQFRREGMSCFNEVWKFLYSCDRNSGRRLPLFRADLRVPVDPMVMASDASSTGGAICRSMGLTARGSGISRQAHMQRTSVCDDEVVLIRFNDNLEACRRAIELLLLSWVDNIAEKSGDSHDA